MSRLRNVVPAMILASLLFANPLYVEGNSVEGSSAEDGQPVTTEELMTQLQVLIEQVQRHPSVQNLTQMITSGELTESLGRLINEYSDSFASLASEAEDGFTSLQQQVQTLMHQADETFAEGNPYDDPIGKAKAAVQALEQRIQEQKEALDNMER